MIVAPGDRVCYVACKDACEAECHHGAGHGTALRTQPGDVIGVVEMVVRWDPNPWNPYCHVAARPTSWLDASPSICDAGTTAHSKLCASYWTNEREV